ncbi:hypothetical protein Daesc_004474 [Daldinia eschscholtzii]|uniref:Uncharacterized protein n=1 Tax=Daldinia eschscholtzii TaxID=292717 RepID=A0AAX6MQ26_9PEZI
MSDVSRLLLGKKVRMIEAWISEVASSEKYCACSRTRALTEIEEESSTSSSTTESELQSSSESSESNKSNKFSSGQAKNPGASLLHHATKPGRTDPLKCFVCGLPLDNDVKMEKLREHEGNVEMGLVRSGSPRSIASLSKMKQVVPPDELTAADILKQNSFKRQLSRSVENFGRRTVTSSRKLKAKGTSGMRSIKKIFSWSGGPSASGGDDLAARKDRPRATETYAQYRLNASSAESVETLAGRSDDDDERRRPGLTIDDSAARLRRAARLLNQTSAQSTRKKANNPPTSQTN